MNIKYKELYYQWKLINGKKPSWANINIRKNRGYTDYEALNVSFNSKTKSFISYNGRECSVCKKFKLWLDFSKSKSSSTGYTCDCLECRREAKKVYRAIKENREKEKEYKKQLRLTEKGKMMDYLDNIYYKDKQIIKNRQILNKFKNITRKQAKINKIDYFSSRGYELEELCKIYGIKYNSYYSCIRPVKD